MTLARPTSSSSPCSSRRASWWPARRRTPASSASSPSTTSWPAATRAACSPRTSRARRCSASPRSRRIDDLPDGPGRPRVRVHARRPPTPTCCAACARRGIKAAFLTSAGYGEAGEAGRRAEHELVALADELGILLAGPNGQGVVSTPGPPVRADRGAVPAGRAHRRRQPERQLRLQLHELRHGDRHRHQPGRVGRQRRGRHRGRLPRLLRRRSGHRGRPRLRRGHRRRPRVRRADPRRWPSASRWCS